MKDDNVRELLQDLATDELPMPDWGRVGLRARFEEEISRRREAFRRLPWVQVAVFVLTGLSLATLAAWLVLKVTGAG
jgi:hypothetical protein